MPAAVCEYCGVVGKPGDNWYEYNEFHKVKEMIIKQVPPRWERLGFNSEEEMKENEQRYNDGQA